MQDTLMVVTDTGFTADARKLAEEHSVYLVEAHSKGFKFKGSMSREDLHNNKRSRY